MDTGYYKFYRDKKYQVFFIIYFAFIFLICGVVLMGCNLTLLGGSCGLISLFLLFRLIPILKNRRPYIEITPDYIQIEGQQKLLWTDIDRIVRPEVAALGVLCELWPKNMSDRWVSPFRICRYLLQDDDLKKLVELLNKKVRYTNLN